MNAPEAYPLGYVEDAFETRTPLAAFFNSLLRPVLRGFHIAEQQIAAGKDSHQLLVAHHRNTGDIPVLE